MKRSLWLFPPFLLLLAVVFGGIFLLTPQSAPPENAATRGLIEGVQLPPIFKTPKMAGRRLHIPPNRAGTFHFGKHTMTLTSSSISTKADGGSGSSSSTFGGNGMAAGSSNLGTRRVYGDGRGGTYITVAGDDDLPVPKDVFPAGAIVEPVIVGEAEVLLSLGANPNALCAPWSHSYTSTRPAEMMNPLNWWRLLEDNRRGIHRRDTVLVMSAQRDRETPFPTVRALLKHGANPNLSGCGYRTALHYAAENGLREMVRLLLDAGAKPDAKDGMGFTPLDFAKKRISTPRSTIPGTDYPGVVKLLEKAQKPKP